MEYRSERTERNVYKMGALVGVCILALLVPHSVGAATDLKVAGWIPWWQAEEGIEAADEHLEKIDTLHPFVFNVSEDGTLIERSDLSDRSWRDLFRHARREDREVIPTVAWFDGAAIDHILSDASLRSAHIESIVELVDDSNFDGIDIDYEGKLAETMDDFSRFLKELKEALSGKLLTCTIEARTPPESKWRVVPTEIEYANDLRAIGRYCDRVEIMAYDQQRIDWRLNDAKSGEPYIPVADAEWVEKVLLLALEDIPAEKIMLGVPTYGREWTVTVAPNWYRAYTNVQSVNLPDALEIAEEYKVTPGRNRAGELSFSYFPQESVFSLLNQLPVPMGTRPGMEAAAKALFFANATGMTIPVHVVWYSDAEAIHKKIELAKQYKLRGISIFKIDGEEDSSIWELF